MPALFSKRWVAATSDGEDITPAEMEHLNALEAELSAFMDEMTLRAPTIRG